MIQKAGTIDIDGGKLIVEGDYRIQSRINNNGEYKYGASSGILKMVKNEDEVVVNGDFVTSSLCNHDGYLTDGVLEVKGDFVQLGTYSRYSFVAKNKHKVILSGDSKQVMSFDNYYFTESRIANFEIKNESNDGVDFKKKVCITGTIKDNDNKTSGAIVIAKESKFYNDSYNGDVWVGSSYNMDKSINIKGNLISDADIYIR